MPYLDEINPSTTLLGERSGVDGEALLKKGVEVHTGEEGGWCQTLTAKTWRAKFRTSWNYNRPVPTRSDPARSLSRPGRVPTSAVCLALVLQLVAEVTSVAGIWHGHLLVGKSTATARE